MGSLRLNSRPCVSPSGMKPTILSSDNQIELAKGRLLAAHSALYAHSESPAGVEVSSILTVL